MIMLFYLIIVFMHKEKKEWFLVIWLFVLVEFGVSKVQELCLPLSWMIDCKGKTEGEILGCAWDQKTSTPIIG